MKKEFYLKPAKRSNYLFLLSYLTITAFICLGGCSSNSIDEDKAVKIYVENVIAEEKFVNNSDSLSANKNRILRKYGVTKSEYEEFFSSMEAKPLVWQNFFKKADEYIAELQKKGELN